jgi:hypothetical protein
MTQRLNHELDRWNFAGFGDLFGRDLFSPDDETSSKTGPGGVTQAMEDRGTTAAKTTHVSEWYLPGPTIS